MIAQQICHVSLYVLHQYACAVCTCKYMYKERKMLFSNKDFFSFNHMHVCKPLIVKYRWIVDLCQYLSHFKNPKFVLIYHLHFFLLFFIFFTQSISFLFESGYSPCTLYKDPLLSAHGIGITHKLRISNNVSSNFFFLYNYFYILINLQYYSTWPNYEFYSHLCLCILFNKRFVSCCRLVYLKMLLFMPFAGHGWGMVLQKKLRFDS